MVRQLPEYMREYARLPTYHHYLTEKFKWAPGTTHQIEWQIIGTTLRRLTPPERIRIRKIIHEWIPTRVSPGNQPTEESDRLCPSCHRHQETPEHLIRCEAPSRRKIRLKLQIKLQSIFTKYLLDPHLYQMWWLGLITLDDPTTHSRAMYPTQFHPIFDNQSKIGWKQLYYGRITKQWNHYLSQHHPTIDAIKVLSQIQHATWSTTLELWEARNNDNAIATANFPPHMLSDLKGIFAIRDRLPQHTQDQIFKYTQEELLTKSKQYIQSWIINSQRFICHELTILNKQQRLNTSDIRQFFPPR